MSQYEKQFDNGILVRCGWDPPLQCFFAHLRDDHVDEDANPVIWIGTGLGGDPTTFGELVKRFREDMSSNGYFTEGMSGSEGHRYLAFLHEHERQLVEDKEANRA